MARPILSYNDADAGPAFAVDRPSPWLTPLALSAGAIYLAIFLAWTVLAAVLKPYSDQYSFIADAWRMQAGGMTLPGYLWMPHVGHHAVWVRLLTLFELNVTRSAWPTVFAATAALLGAAAIQFCQGAVDRRLSALRWTVAVLCTMPMLCAINALDANQPINALYCFSIVFALLSLSLFQPASEATPSTTQRLLAIVAAMAAALGNGAALALWPALALLALLDQRPRRWMWVGVVLAIGVIFSGLYLSGPGEIAELGASGGGRETGFGRRVLYLLVYLALPFSQASRVIGVVGGLATLALAGAAIKTALDRGPSGGDRFAIGMITFTLITAVLAATGRGGLTGELIAPTRYAVFVAPLQAGVVMLLAPWIEQRFVERASTLSAAMTAVLVVALAGQVASSVFTARVAMRTRQTIADYEAGLRTPLMTQLIFDDLPFADAIDRRLRAERSFGKAPAELAAPASSGTARTP